MQVKASSEVSVLRKWGFHTTAGSRLTKRTEDIICSEVRSWSLSKCSLTIVEMTYTSNLIACRHFLFTENGSCKVIEMTCKFRGHLASTSFKGIKRNRLGEIRIFLFDIFHSKGSSFVINRQLFRKMWKIIIQIQSCGKKCSFLPVLRLLINNWNAAIF